MRNLSAISLRAACFCLELLFQAANYALQQTTNEVLGKSLPIAYGKSTTVATANFFGIGQQIESSEVKSDQLSVSSPIPGVSVGIGYDRESTTYIDKKGRRILKEVSPLL